MFLRYYVQNNGTGGWMDRRTTRKNNSSDCDFHKCRCINNGGKDTDSDFR